MSIFPFRNLYSPKTDKNSHFLLPEIFFQYFCTSFVYLINLDSIVRTQLIFESGLESGLGLGVNSGFSRTHTSLTSILIKILGLTIFLEAGGAIFADVLTGEKFQNFKENISTKAGYKV